MKNIIATDTSSGPQLGERAMWDMDSADHECDCPGPPPQFHLPPPPRPPFLIDSECSENPISDLETCEAVPVSIIIIFFKNIIKIEMMLISQMTITSTMIDQ